MYTLLYTNKLALLYAIKIYNIFYISFQIILDKIILNNIYDINN